MRCEACGFGPEDGEGDLITVSPVLVDLHFHVDCAEATVAALQEALP